MPLDPLQLQRWIDGTSDDTERAEIEMLLATQPQLLDDLLNESWDKADAVMPAEASDRLKAALQAKLKLRGRIRSMLWRAAVAAVIIGVMITLRRHRQTDSPAPAPEMAIQWKTVVNTHANIVKITLPDSSFVWLHQKATLQYVTHFKTNRQVKLSGEAFFEVAANAHPFTLTAGSLHTTVLGTQFNVEAYPMEQMTRVSLISGKVAVKFAAGEVVLQPGKALIADAQGVREESVNVLLSDAWTGNSLVFNHLPLADVLRRIGDHYGKHIRFDAPLPTGLYFNSVLPGNDLKAALSNLSFVYKLHFHQQGDTLRVTL
ncbi:FecR family protein [Chitinophaga sp. YR627]|uniref:FecR family protein n=1 Tax=Chitinophaga sp. YR627 TaxID=1881041 RepID=UPI0008E0386C|nr:FecR domain-containing protein [Chitinophaga sp. YR627]SFM86555.1 FecR family protein [Chitinophaga sp. YR627]